MSDVDNAPATDQVITEAPIESAPAEARFYDGWSEESMGNPNFDKFKDGTSEDLFKSYAEQSKLVGWKGDIPSQDAEPDEWNAFYSKMGKPEDTSGYEFAPIEGLEVPQEYMSKVAETALKHNLSKSQAEGFIADMLGHEKELMSASQEAQSAKEQEGVDMLNREWGESKDEMIAGIRQLLGRYGIAGEAAEGIEANPQAMLLVGKIAHDLDEKGQAGTTFNATRAGIEDQMTELTSRITEIMTETRNPKDPRLTPLLEKRTFLQDKLDS